MIKWLISLILSFTVTCSILSSSNMWSGSDRPQQIENQWTTVGTEYVVIDGIVDPIDGSVWLKLENGMWIQAYSGVYLGYSNARLNEYIHLRSN